MRKLAYFFLLLFVFSALGLPLAVAAVRYQHVQATAEVSSSPVSRYVSVKIHLRNIGGIAAACVVKASGQTRVTGLSIGGTADVEFNALRSYKGYTVACKAN